MRFKKTDKNTSKKADKAGKSSGKSAAAVSGRTVIGLDITQNHVRMVQLSAKSGNHVRLDKYAIQPLPKNVVVGTEINDFDMLVEHLQQCYAKLKTGCKSVNLALPAGIVTIEDNLQYSADAELSVQELVEAEVARVGALDEMNYDWQELPQVGKEKDSPLLMVAAKTEDVNQRVDLLDEIGLTAVNMDVDVLAVFNAFSFVNETRGNEFSQERVALFDVGDVTMRALIVENGRILYRHDSNFGLDQLVQLTQRNYQTTEDEALEMVSGRRARPEGYQTEVVDIFNMQIGQEVQRAMQFFLTTRSDSQSDIHRILISGSGCLSGTGLAEVVRIQTEIPTEHIAPASLAENKTKVGIDQFDGDANSLTTAFGLALRGLF